jgi:hypothetical protein
VRSRTAPVGATMDVERDADGTRIEIVRRLALKEITTP